MMDNPAAILGIDHVVIATRNISAMLNFYQTVFGCSLERTVTEIRLFQMRAGTALIDILEIDGHVAEFPASRKNMEHLCLALKNWDLIALENHLNKNGITFTESEDRYGALGFGPSIYVKDPDGNTIELKGPPTHYS